jgi:hypothetical protein
LIYRKSASIAPHRIPIAQKKLSCAVHLRMTFSGSTLLSNPKDLRFDERSFVKGHS